MLLVTAHNWIHMHKTMLTIWALCCDIMYSISQQMIFNDLSILLNWLTSYC